MFKLGRLYCTSRGFDLLTSWKKRNYLFTRNKKIYEKTFIPHHFLFSISEKYCTKFHATRSSRNHLIFNGLWDFYLTLHGTFIAASDTTTIIAIQWTMSEVFATHLSVLRKAHKELDVVVGHHRKLVQESDLPHLKCLRCIL
jgi:hypothetical protein